MSVYYNENDPKAAGWLRELMKQNLIASGEVDERSIEDVTPNDVRGFKQAHFFAGIGGWSKALRLAGWGDDRSVWTGSCPCQPFSSAGKRAGVVDERHLWPAFFWLIRECKPDVIFGEQVASKDGISWLDVVSHDLEMEKYDVGAVVLPACGVGAPEKRERLWFVAHPNGRYARKKWEQRSGQQRFFAEDGSPLLLADTKSKQSHGRRNQGRGRRKFANDGGARDVADSSSLGHDGRGPSEEMRNGPEELERLRNAGPLGNTPSEGSLSSAHSGVHSEEKSGGSWDGESQRPGPVNGYWGNAEWIYCSDEKWRPVEPGTFPLAHGVSNRVGLLRGYGNAIVPQVAAKIIEAYREFVE